MSNGDYPVRHLFLLPMLLVTTANVDDQRMHFVLDPAHSDIRASVAFLGIGSQTARFPSASGKAVLDPGNIEAMQLDMLIDARAVTAGEARGQRPQREAIARRRRCCGGQASSMSRIIRRCISWVSISP